MGQENLPYSCLSVTQGDDTPFRHEGMRFEGKERDKEKKNGRQDQWAPIDNDIQSKMWRDVRLPPKIALNWARPYIIIGLRQLGLTGCGPMRLPRATAAS